MTRRCNSVDPDRHPAESKKIGVGDSSSVSGIRNSRSAARPDKVFGFADLARKYSFRALGEPWKDVRR